MLTKTTINILITAMTTARLRRSSFLAAELTSCKEDVAVSRQKLR